ncbi:MAG: hypothetical protein U9R25_10280 [Chloroflexota bacterium]|nr:hypothetical protein [Chloroflexota bacterium]
MRRGQGTAALQPAELATMVQMVATTRPDEIGCDECFEQLDRFAELELAGKNAAEAMPLVQDHLDRCNDCREEFEMLLVVLQATADGV